MPNTSNSFIKSPNNSASKMLEIAQKLAQLTTVEQQANTAFSKKEFSQALKFYKEKEAILKFLLAQPNNNDPTKYNKVYIDTLIKIGNCCYDTEDHLEAINYFKKALLLNENLINVDFYLARSYYRLNNLIQAKPLAEKVSKCTENDFSNLKIQTSLTYQKLIKANNALLGHIARQMKDNKTAKMYFQKADIHFHLAEIAFEEEDHKETIKQCSLALKVNNDESTPLSQKEIDKTHYYWAISLIINILDKPIITEKEDSNNISFAILLLEKRVDNTEDAEIPFTLAKLYDEERFGNKNPKKALEYYKQAAKLKHAGALHDLACIYEEGKGVEKNLKTAFKYFKKAANLGFAKSQTDLARCYINGIGCTIDLPKAKIWAEKAAATEPLAKYYLACVLWMEASPESANRKLAMEAVDLFKQAIEEEDIAPAYFNLGLSYDLGWPIFKKDYEQAEYYYREAIRLGLKEACINLFQLYAERLEQAHTSDNNYNELKNACQEILNEFEAILTEENITKDVLNSITQRNKKRYTSCILINESIKNTAVNTKLTPEKRILKIFDKTDLKTANTINLSTAILKIGDLFDKTNKGIEFFKKHKDKICSFLDECLNRLKDKKFSIRSICNIITGVSKFYQQGYHEKLDEVLTKAFNTLKGKFSGLDLLSINSLLAASIRTNLKSNLLAEHIQSLVNICLEKQMFSANILYNLAVLDNYKKVYPEFSFNINRDSLAPIIEYAKKSIVAKELDIKDRHQYFLALFYFTRCYSDFNNNDIEMLLIEQMQLLNKQPMQTHTSNLQNKVFTYVQQYLPGCKAEFVINTLPIDIYWKNSTTQKNLIIPVNGPSHYVFTNTEGEHTLTPKDCFHEAILKCQFRTDQPINYEIIPIDFMKYEAKGNSHIDEQLSLHGIKFTKISNQNSIYKSNDEYPPPPMQSYQKVENRPNIP